jgi:hypothetical protein
MSGYPRTAPERRAERARLRETVMNRAEQEADRVWRSFRCGEGDHARMDPHRGREGCANNGSSCICECHDVIEEAST